MLDLEERLSRHYADVATAPSLHRRTSAFPRLAFVGVMLALLVGAVFASGLLSSGENLITTPSPDIESVENDSSEESAIDPELLRLLERAPYLEERGGLTYLDLTVARQGPMEGLTDSAGTTVLFPDALTWSPSPSAEVSNSYRYPTDYEAAFGYGFDDIERSLSVGLGGHFFTNTFVVIDNDASAALDRATAPTWATQDVRNQEGPFDIRNWGDWQEDLIPRESSDVRPLGEAGQLTAFDGNITLQSVRRDLLDDVVATESGAPTLADQQQLIGGLRQLEYENSLGFVASINPDAVLNSSSGEGEAVTGPTLWIVETNLDGSSRVVLGFLPGINATDVETNLRSVLDANVDVAGEFAEPALMDTTISRSGEFVIVDFAPSDSPILSPNNGYVWDFMRTLLFENPEVLS